MQLVGDLVLSCNTFRMLVSIQLSSSFANETLINPFPNKPWFLCVCCTSLLKTLWEKEKIARNEQFLLFPQCFLPFSRTFFHIHQIQNYHLQTLSVWKSLKFVVLERIKDGTFGLNIFITRVMAPYILYS